MNRASTRPGRIALAALLFAFGLATPAHAHLVETGFGTFYDGIAHLVLTPADLLLVLGLGLLAGLRGAETARPLLFALPASWLAGGLLGTANPGAGELAWGMAVSVVLTGALVATNLRLARAPVITLACTAGLLHGYAGAATLTAADPLRLTGTVLASFVLVALAAGLTVGLRSHWQEIAVRVAGSWIAAVGLLMIGWQLRG